MYNFKNTETHSRRSFTPQRNRNPILLNERTDQEQFKQSKARVPEYLVHTKWSEERPRGLATGEFSRLNQSSISFVTQSTTEHKPIRKMIKVDHKSETVIKPIKRIRPSSSGRNPILQNVAGFEPEIPKYKPGVFSSPSALTIISNQKKYLMTSEWSISNKER